MAKFTERLAHAWNAFMSREPTEEMKTYSYGGSISSYRPDRLRMTRGNERSIITSVFNRIALDVAALDFQHVYLDKNGRYIQPVNSTLNECLTLEANRDQTSRAFFHDAVMSMFDEGCVALIPTDTSTDPRDRDAYKIHTLRTGKVVEWYPEHVKLEVYNENRGEKQQIILPKKMVPIVENPWYSIINEPNSVMQRLIRKLNILDSIDEQSGSGKLDLIIQLPYVIRSDAKRQQAEERRAAIEEQLSGSKYGIAYADGTERITQLNRPVENNLMSQVEYLTSMLYSQLGITTSILDGTADEKVMLNYQARTIEPIAAAFVTEMERKFLTKTARTQKQAIRFFMDPFRLIPATELAEIADKFTRNEIFTSNEIRQIAGMKPSSDPKADELRNKNLNAQASDDTFNVDESNDDNDMNVADNLAEKYLE